MVLLIVNLANLFLKAVYVYSSLLGIYALLSWFPGGYDTGFGRLLSRICEPYLRIFDRLNLNIGGIGFSIIVAIFVLNIGSKLIVDFIFALLRLLF